MAPLQHCSISIWLQLGVGDLPFSHPQLTCTMLNYAFSLGGYAFITNMIPLHALALTLMGRFTSRLYVGYSSWYAIGTLASMQVPFVGFQPVRTSEHMGALGMSIARFDLSFPAYRLPPQVSLVSCKSSHLFSSFGLMCLQNSFNNCYLFL